MSGYRVFLVVVLADLVVFLVWQIGWLLPMMYNQRSWWRR